LFDGAVLLVFAAMVAVLFLLGLWQRRVDQSRREEAEASLYEARSRGTDRPLAQHPQIDAQACIGCGSCIAACPEEGVIGLVDGVARVVHGSRCIGHGRCAEVCPVGAIQVGLGDLASHPDLPVLSEDLETSVPGVYIAGELGGMALIRVAAHQAVQAIDAIAASLDPERPADDDLMDVLVVGAGPAGIAAALRCTELGLSYVVIDQDDIGGTVRKYPRQKLTLTGPMTLPLVGKVTRSEFLKEELIAYWEEIIARYELDLRAGIRMTGVEGAADDFVVRTDAGDARARRVLLALGRRGTPAKLGVPGEDRENVLYQLVDAADCRDQHILVVGGGDSAIEAATALAEQPGNEVVVAYRRDGFFRLKARNLARIEEFAAAGRLEVRFRTHLEEVRDGVAVLATEDADGNRVREEIANDRVFVFAGGELPRALLQGIGVRLGGEPTPAAAPELAEVEA